MEKPAQNKLHGLDHLRALAIASVFLFHYFILSKGQPEWLPDFARFSWTGVDLFFVLSGFLISSRLFQQINQGQVISFKQFFFKRFFRIVPAFIFTIALYFLIPSFREKESLPPLWKFLTFTQNFGLNLKDYGAFSHAWSLCVEEHFYLFFPLLLILLQKNNLIKRSYWILVILLLLGFAIRFYSYENLYLPRTEGENPWMYWYKYVYYPTYNRLDGLIAGVTIAAVYRFLPDVWKTISKYGNLLLIVSLVILTGAYFLCYEQMTFQCSVFGYPLIAVGYGLMVMSAISPTCFLYKFHSRFTSFIAALSYAIYLTHKGVIHVAHQLLTDCEINPNLLLIICIICCAIFAYILHITIEKPFMRLRGRFVNKETN